MGVPKFYRWLSERYPKINQRFASPPNAETCHRYFDGRDPPDPLDPPDPMALCGLPPEIDRLYIDMNGIIHGCSHNNDDGPTKDDEISEAEIFTNVCYYLDRLIGDMAQPTELVYMAIDGVAPRAKLNQQRSRRYRSGVEGQMETNIYQAHMLRKIQEEQRQREEEELEIVESQNQDNLGWEPKWLTSMWANGSVNDNVNRADKIEFSTEGDAAKIQEILPGRFKGKFEGSDETVIDGEDGHHADDDDDPFHSNIITPGTEFFQEFTRHLEHFVQYKLNTDPKWQHLTIILSGPNVPGEGEHKIMQFIREQKADTKSYDPNIRHCIMGQDGDLIMLGLATHEPNLVLLRERVVFSMAKRRVMEAASAVAASSSSSSTSSSTESTSEKSSTAGAVTMKNGALDAYIHNPHFEFLHMGVLRDYIAFELETSNVLADSSWDIERTIDDFVFITFLVGNDFLPHMPALDIADHAFDLLFYTYKNCRSQWLEEERARNRNHDDQQNHDCYLTNAGSIVSGRRLEHFLTAVGSHEVTYYDKKKQTASDENKRLRKQSKRFGWDGSSTIPSDAVVASKEESDRAAYRQMLIEQHQRQSSGAVNGATHSGGEAVGRATTSSGSTGNVDDFTPVLSGQVVQTEQDFKPSREELDTSLLSRMGSLLQRTLISAGDDKATKTSERNVGTIDDQDLKGRYYFDKFQFSPFDADKHRALRKAYIEGLVWNLKYYYQGCVSWEWFYPYHYGPMLSDLVDLDELLEEITFDGKLGSPLKPFEQLLGCMPPSQAHHLPVPYRKLMTDDDSPIRDFYPKSFTIDMNGKRYPWEAVVLLPFIDSKRLLEAAATIDETSLSEEERARNAEGMTVVLTHDPTIANPVHLPGISGGEVFKAIEDCRTVIIPFSKSKWNYTLEETPLLKPKLTPGIVFPLPGFGSLRDAPIKSLWRRKMGVNVFGTRSSYKTACLEISGLMPPLPPFEELGPQLVGIAVYVNYPYFIEGLVTAVSDEKWTVRGHNPPRLWTETEAANWKVQRDGITRLHESGEGYTGTGGLDLPEDQPITLSVRPLERLTTASDGSKVKIYANFEIEVPLITTFWAPSAPDPRLDGLQAKLEQNAFEIALPIRQASPASKSKRINGQKKKKMKLLPTVSKANKTVSGAIEARDESELKISFPNEETALSSATDGPILPAKERMNSVATPEEPLLPLTNEPLLFVGDTENTRSVEASNEPLLPMQGNEATGNASASINLLPGTDRSQLISESKRSFSTNRRLDQPGSEGNFYGYSFVQTHHLLAAKATRVDPVHNPANNRRASRSFTSMMLRGPSQGSVTLGENLVGSHRGFRSTVTVPSHSSTMRFGSVRGRLLAAGLLAASFLVNAAGAVMSARQGYFFTDPQRRSTADSSRWCDVRLASPIPNEHNERSVLSVPFTYSTLRGGDIVSLAGNLDSQEKAPALQFAHGTTTLSFTFQSGIIVAVDSRASLGSFVGSKTVQKVIPINSHMLGTMAGGAADCSFWIRKLKSQAMLHELKEGHRMSVARASRMLSNFLYQLRGLNLSVGTMILGFDDPGDKIGGAGSSEGGSLTPRIYYVDNTGVRLEGDMFSVGSGSTFALSILDTERRHDMTEDEAIALGIKAIRHATFRDAYSGGFINVYLITQKDGWKKVFTEDLARTAQILMKKSSTED